MTRNRRAVLALAIIFELASFKSPGVAQSGAVIDGFSPRTSEAERRVEEQFRAVPQPATAREELRRLTSEPHIAGSREDYATAVCVRDQMRSFGLQSHLKEYQWFISVLDLC